MASRRREKKPKHEGETAEGTRRSEQEEEVLHGEASGYFMKDSGPMKSACWSRGKA